MIENNIDSLFERAIEYRDNKDLNMAKETFLKIINLHPNDEDIHVIYITLGGVLKDMKEFEESHYYFKKTSELRPASELASLCTYISLINLNEDEKAIREMKRYLDKHPAKRYKITIQELLGDLQNGYATSYKDVIEKIAEKNAVTLESDLSEEE